MGIGEIQKKLIKAPPYPRVKHKREKGNPTPQPPKGAYGTLESWGRYAGAPAEARESRGEAVSRTWGRVCVYVWWPMDTILDFFKSNGGEFLGIFSFEFRIYLVTFSENLIVLRFFSLQFLEIQLDY